MVPSIRSLRLQYYPNECLTKSCLLEPISVGYTSLALISDTVTKRVLVLREGEMRISQIVICEKARAISLVLFVSFNTLTTWTRTELE